MPLTGSEIKKQVAAGNIIIDPFDEAQVNPNSYNVRLGEELGIYVGTIDVQAFEQLFEQEGPLPRSILDCRKDNTLHYLKMPKAGALLYPGKLYLGATVEYTYTPKHVPVIDGRSSLARLGVKVHVTGGFGDIGFKGHWTLEIEVTEPVRIYPNMQFAQIRFHEPVGTIDMVYQGKYLGDVRPTASRIHKEISDDGTEHNEPRAAGSGTPEDR